jgi:hypothetical protein
MKYSTVEILEFVTVSFRCKKLQFFDCIGRQLAEKSTVAVFLMKAENRFVIVPSADTFFLSSNQLMLLLEPAGQLFSYYFDFTHSSADRLSLALGSADRFGLAH